jgi:hypothetical protein
MRSTLLLGLLSLSACGPITFTAGLKGEAQLQGSPLGSLLSVFPQVGNFTNLDFNENQDFKNNNAARERVKSMTVTSFTIRISSPNDQDFSFLDSLEFFAKTDGQEAKIAGKTNIGALNLAAPNPTLVMDVESVDLSPFVRAATMSITVKGTGRQPPKDTTLSADAKFLVGVGL